MHTVIRSYTAPAAVMTEAQPKLAELEQTMRQLPGFVAYYFVQTDDGLATITITESEIGTPASMGFAAEWVQQHLTETGAALSAPAVIRGQTLLAATAHPAVAAV